VHTGYSIGYEVHPHLRLCRYTEALGKLKEVLKRDERSVGILEYQLHGE